MLPQDLQTTNNGVFVYFIPVQTEMLFLHLPNTVSGMSPSTLLFRVDMKQPALRFEFILQILQTILHERQWIYFQYALKSQKSDCVSFLFRVHILKPILNRDFNFYYTSYSVNEKGCMLFSSFSFYHPVTRIFQVTSCILHHQIKKSKPAQECQRMGQRSIMECNEEGD